MSSDFQPEASEGIFEEMQAYIAKAAGKPDWRYSDLPLLAEEYFDKYISIVGEENIHWLALAEVTTAEGAILRRGQHLISPEGMLRGREYVATLPAQTIMEP